MYSNLQPVEIGPKPAPEGVARTTAVGRRLDLRRLGPGERHQTILDAFAALEPEQGFSFLSPSAERDAYGELGSQHGEQLEWYALEQGPEMWDVVVARLRPGVRRRQVLDCMQADHFRIDDLMRQVSLQAQRGGAGVHAVCRRLATALRRHLRMEDEVLLPVVAERLASPRPPVSGLNNDHQRIESLLAEMLEVSAGVGGGGIHSHDLVGLADDLEDVLLRHVGLEERVLYAVTDLLATSAERDQLVRRCQETGSGPLEPED